MSSPSIPDPADGSAAGIRADLGNYPQNWLVNTLAQTGGTYTGANGKKYDFTNLGNVATQAKMSDTTAKALLDIQKNFGADYVKQRLADLKQADPTGYAARQQLFDKIMADAEKAPPNAQLSSDLQAQVKGMLDTAGQLDPQGKQQVQQQVRGNQVARGIVLGNAPAAEEATAIVGASDALRTQQQNQAGDFLKSGITPDDIEFRKIQQDLSNLGAFQNNQTPQAQFGQVAGAGNGAAPFSTPNYQTPYSLNPNAAEIGQNFQQSTWQTSQQQANPWLAGASLGTGALNLTNNLATAYSNYNNPVATINRAVNSNPNYLNQTPTMGAVPIGNQNIGGIGT